MNKIFLKRTNTTIELTSLLDVIFIVLMIVICNQNFEAEKTIEAAQGSVVEAEARIAEADKMMNLAEAVITENTMLKEQVELCTDIFSQVTLVTVSVTYTLSNPRQRVIRISVNDNEPEKLTMLTPAEPHKGFEELTESLKSILEDSAGRPVILSVDRSQILYRDDIELTRILNKFGGYSNLYMRAGTDE
ncbi:MAG: hypothetical protein MJ059_08900 [Lachnospiraceae bacterium]|nr:hypothetical protein [Lachnospiraceae bacterium]